MGRDLRGEAELLWAEGTDWRIIKRYTVEDLPSVPMVRIMGAEIPVEAGS